MKGSYILYKERWTARAKESERWEKSGQANTNNKKNTLVAIIRIEKLDSEQGQLPGIKKNIT